MCCSRGPRPNSGAADPAASSSPRARCTPLRASTTPPGAKSGAASSSRRGRIKAAREIRQALGMLLSEEEEPLNMGEKNRLARELEFEILGLGPLEQHKYFLPISGEPRLLVMARKV